MLKYNCAIIQIIIVVSDGLLPPNMTYPSGLECLMNLDYLFLNQNLGSLQCKYSTSAHGDENKMFPLFCERVYLYSKLTRKFLSLSPPSPLPSLFLSLSLSRGCNFYNSCSVPRINETCLLFFLLRCIFLQLSPAGM